MSRRAYQAFTLIEIMIAIAIIAILAGILVPNFMKAREEAKLAASKQNIVALAKVVNMALIRHGNGFAHWMHSEIDEDCVLVQYGYLKAIPKCPFCDGYYSVYYYPEHDREDVFHTCPNTDRHISYNLSMGFYE